ncbi:hist_deacetyl domain-containing protein, partial [Haematococcus lacustris]
MACSALSGHPVVYHPDMQIQPVAEGHRFPMPKDHLLYLALCEEGLAGSTFTPAYPDRDTLLLAHTPDYVDSYHPDMQIQPVAEGHRFPMPKDHLLYLALREEGLAGSTFTPAYPDRDTLLLAHTPDYVDSFLEGRLSASAMRSIGLPWSPALVQRTLVGTGSAVLAARLALQYGVACMCNGGTHHAHPSHGSGWCVFNDQAVAARAAQRDAGVGKVLFVDLDVHQGDGTAAIFQDDPSVFTFSLHCSNQGFPARLQASDLDVGLPAGTGDAEYMAVLQEVLPGLLANQRPDLVMYNAGTCAYTKLLPSCYRIF